MNKEEAQRRVDRMLAFREELAQVESEGLLSLTEEERCRLDTYHRGLQSELARLFDVDGGVNHFV